MNEDYKKYYQGQIDRLEDFTTISITLNEYLDSLIDSLNME